MKMTQLKDIIREIINEQIDAMDEDSQAAKAAKQQGLTYMSFGRYGKDGQVTHKSERGRLVPVKTSGDVGLRPGKTSASQDKMYRAMPSRGATGMDSRAAAIKGPDGKLQRAEPRYTPDVNRERNKPQPAPGIPKDSHKNPETNNRVAAVMDKFKINQDGYGGGFGWVDDKEGGYYEYDDNEGGYDYYAEVRPLDNDEYDVTIGDSRRNDPVRVKGLKGVKQHLESSDDE